MKPALHLAWYGIREMYRLPFVWGTAGVTAFLLFVFHLLPMFLDESGATAMVRDLGLSTILLWGLLVVWLRTAGFLHEEIEQRTAVVLLSTPLSREGFLMGKFLGVAAGILPLFATLGGVLVYTIWRKEGYGPYGFENPGIDEGTIVGLALAYGEVVMLGAVSLLLSTFLPWLPSILACVGIFLSGRLAGYLTGRLFAGRGEVLEALASGNWQALWQASPAAALAEAGRLVLPDLSQLDVQEALVAGVPIPVAYLGWAAVYCALYTAVVLYAACRRMRRVEIT
jgi:ABC-type transport system involved in multi-copper enzyme maturation permease subunit